MNIDEIKPDLKRVDNFIALLNAKDVAGAILANSACILFGVYGDKIREALVRDSEYGANTYDETAEAIANYESAVKAIIAVADKEEAK